MTKTLQLIPGILMPYYAIIVLGIIVTVLWGGLGLTNYVVRDWTLSWEGQCTVGDWKEDGMVGFNVDCGDNGKAVIIDSDIVRSYMDDPGPITCRRYLTDSISCDARPRVEVEDKT